MHFETRKKMMKFQYLIAFLVAISSLTATDPTFTINYVRITKNIAGENFNAAGPNKTTPNLCNQDNVYREYACKYVMETMEKIGTWMPNTSSVNRNVKFYSTYRIPVHHTQNAAFAVLCTRDRFVISDEYFNSENASSSTAGSASKPTFKGIIAISEGSTPHRIFVYVMAENNYSYRNMTAVLQIDNLDFQTYVRLLLVAKKLESIASRSDEKDDDDS